ncbi:MAG: hypothetical protein ACRC5T_11070 [Cetobacterium sp.]
MSNTKQEKLKIEATNKAFLEEHKKDALKKLIELFKKNKIKPKLYFKFITYKLLTKCDCNKATIDFIINEYEI